MKNEFRQARKEFQQHLKQLNQQIEQKNLELKQFLEQHRTAEKQLSQTHRQTALGKLKQIHALKKLVHNIETRLKTVVQAEKRMDEVQRTVNNSHNEPVSHRPNKTKSAGGVVKFFKSLFESVVKWFSGGLFSVAKEKPTEPDVVFNPVLISDKLSEPLTQPRQRSSRHTNMTSAVVEQARRDLAVESLVAEAEIELGKACLQTL